MQAPCHLGLCTAGLFNTPAGPEYEYGSICFFLASPKLAGPGYYDLGLICSLEGTSAGAPTSSNLSGVPWCFPKGLPPTPVPLAQLVFYLSHPSPVTLTMVVSIQLTASTLLISRASPFLNHSVRPAGCPITTIGMGWPSFLQGGNSGTCLNGQAALRSFSSGIPPWDKVKAWPPPGEDSQVAGTSVEQHYIHQLGAGCCP